MAEGDFNIKAVISAETSKFESGLKNAEKSLGSLSNSINGISKMLSSAFSIIGITASVGAVVNFGKKSVQAADEANRRFNILNNTIKATGAETWTSAEEMDKAAKSYAKSTNYSVSEIEKMQSVLLGFRNITGETFDEATEAILDMSTVMGMDLTSSVQTVGKALDDPVKGLDSLRRQGFAFTEEQKLELQQLVKNGDQLKAQKIILDELATTYGGAAKAGQSAFAQFQHSMDSFQEAIGNALMPSINKVLKGMSQFMEQIEKGLSSKQFVTVIAVLQNSFSILGNTIIKLGGYFSNFFNEIKNLISIFNVAPIQSFIDTLIGLANDLFENNIKKQFDNFLETLKIIKENLQNFLSSDTFAGIMDWVNAFIDGFIFLKNELQEIISIIVDNIYQNLNRVWETVKSFFNNTSDALANSETNIKSWSDFLWEVLDNVFKIFQDVLYGIKALLQGDFSLAFDYARLAALRWLDNMLTAISTLANAFPQAVQTVIDGLNKIIEGINTIREFFGQEKLNLLESFESIDLSESLGIEKQISKIEKEIESKTGKAADYSIKEIKKVSTQFSGESKKIISDLTKVEEVSEKSSEKISKQFSITGTKGINKLKAALKTLKEQIEKDANDWSDVVGNAYTTMTELGSQMFETLGQDLIDGGASFEDYAATAVSAIAEVLKSLAAQLTALAVARAANYDYGTAAMAAAGAAAALVAAGVLGGVAKAMKTSSEETKKATEEMNAIGEAAVNAKGSIEYFLETLKKIKEGYEDYSLSNYYSTIIAYQNLYEEQVTAISKRFDDMKKEQSEINEFLKSNAEYIFDIQTWLERTFYGFISNESLGIIRNPELVKLENKLAESKFEYEELKKIASETAKEIISTSKSTISALKEQVIINEQTIKGYNDLYTARILLNELQVEFNKLSDEEQRIDFSNYQKALEEGSGNLIDTLSFQIEYVKNLNEIALSEQKAAISNIATDVYKSLSSTGSAIGQTLVSGIIDGMSKKDFMTSMRNYFRETLMNLTLYTNKFQDQLAQIGVNLTQALLTKGDLKSIKKEISDLWEVTKEGAKEVEEVIAEVFGEIRDEVEDTTEQIGTNIFDNLISALSEGLSQGQFLENMKKYIRDMLIQTLVYTQAMKSEIEAIGKAISDGLTQGFTDTSLHEIRRDLSYIFNEANKTMSGIDSVLDTVFGGYATGTQNAMSGLHLVGESGPELVRFRGGEQVLNAQNTQTALEGMSGTTNNFNVTFNNLQDTSAYAMMNQLRAYNREMSINGII